MQTKVEQTFQSYENQNIDFKFTYCEGNLVKKIQKRTIFHSGDSHKRFL
jgi:hypothetical protein